MELKSILIGAGLVLVGVAIVPLSIEAGNIYKGWKSEARYDANVERAYAEIDMLVEDDNSLIPAPVSDFETMIKSERDGKTYRRTYVSTRSIYIDDIYTRKMTEANCTIDTFRNITTLGFRIEEVYQNEAGKEIGKFVIPGGGC